MATATENETAPAEPEKAAPEPPEQDAPEEAPGAHLTHVVRRNFSAAGQALRPGQCVDATNWRTAHKLEDQRRIVPIADRITPVQSKDGRWWENEDLAHAADAGSGKQRGSAERPAKQPPAAKKDKSFPKKLGRGRYLLSSGDEYKGSKANAEKLEEELQAKQG